MNRFLALFLAALMLLQTLGQEVLVVDYQLHKARVAALYCVNKARPQLHCNGQCHLAQELRKADGGDKKAPASALAKVKYEALPSAAFALPARRRGQRPAQRFARPRVVRCVAGRDPGVFRPPLLLV